MCIPAKVDERPYSETIFLSSFLLGSVALPEASDPRESNSLVNSTPLSGNQDILICGNCREMYTDLHDLLEHKKTYCKLRFTCKCDSNKSSE
jgi:hypothetical protein